MVVEADRKDTGIRHGPAFDILPGNRCIWSGSPPCRLRTGSGVRGGQIARSMHCSHVPVRVAAADICVSLTSHPGGAEWQRAAKQAVCRADRPASLAMVCSGEPTCLSCARARALHGRRANQARAVYSPLAAVHASTASVDFAVTALENPPVRARMAQVAHPLDQSAVRLDHLEVVRAGVRHGHNEKRSHGLIRKIGERRGVSGLES